MNELQGKDEQGIKARNKTGNVYGCQMKERVDVSS